MRGRQMNTRQRYRETMLFGNPDKVPLYPGGPRESTLKAWRAQGLPEGVPYMAAVLGNLGIDPEAALAWRSAPVNFRMIPEYESVVLEHRNGHYIIRDWMGAITEISDRYDATYLRSAKDFVTRKWHKFPVETREDWQEMKKRFDPLEPSRLGEDFEDVCRELKDSSQPVRIGFDGIFWQLREWCGMENLCLLMLDNPDFVAEMAQYWTDFVSVMLGRILPHIRLDGVVISEDMAYKAHSMISPAMTREFILPAYKTWVPLIKNSGCLVVEMDSDGFIEDLAPIWIEAGINACSPVEVAAGCDIKRMRRAHGKKMAFVQGIDKRVIAAGGDDLKNLVDDIVPFLFRTGGYIPGCDHAAPPDISWQNYNDFIRLLAQHSGWL